MAQSLHMDDWQTWVAGGIVFITLTLFIRSFTRRSKKGCGSNCGCDLK